MPNSKFIFDVIIIQEEFIADVIQKMPWRWFLNQSTLIEKVRFVFHFIGQVVQDLKALFF